MNISFSLVEISFSYLVPVAKAKRTCHGLVGRAAKCLFKAFCDKRGRWMTKIIVFRNSNYLAPKGPQF